MTKPEMNQEVRKSLETGAEKGIERLNESLNRILTLARSDTNEKLTIDAYGIIYSLCLLCESFEETRLDPLGDIEN